MTLFYALLTIDVSDFLLIQNPPALPGIGVCFLYCKLFKVKLVIDWHNYAYSILALSVGDKHKLVKISKWYEFFIGSKSENNLCVTQAMRKDLMDNHKINAITFYDCPPDFFHCTTVEEKHNLFLSLGLKYKIFLNNCDSNETVFTKVNASNKVVLNDDRPAFLISSTSWTEDEDFSILLSALESMLQSIYH